MADEGQPKTTQDLDESTGHPNGPGNASPITSSGENRFHEHAIVPIRDHSGMDVGLNRSKWQAARYRQTRAQCKAEPTRGIHEEMCGM